MESKLTRYDSFKEALLSQPVRAASLYSFKNEKPLLSEAIPPTIQFHFSDEDLVPVCGMSYEDFSKWRLDGIKSEVVEGGLLRQPPLSRSLIIDQQKDQ